MLVSEPLRCLNPKGSWVEEPLLHHGGGGGDGNGTVEAEEPALVFGERNPSPNSSERLLKDPVYRLAKHPGLPSNKIHPVRTDARRGLTDLKHNHL